MESNRRSFIKIAGVAGAGWLAGGTVAGMEDVPEVDKQPIEDSAAFTTELFLDNEMIEASPGVSRRLHPAKKHPLNPVVRCDLWCDGEYIQPYTTMYDAR